MTNVRAKCDQYPPKDKFNLDESGLWWKLTPNRTLVTEGGSGSKASKDRITIAFTCNADGSEKLDAWIIGRFKTLVALRVLTVICGVSNTDSTRPSR